MPQTEGTAHPGRRPVDRDAGVGRGVRHRLDRLAPAGGDERVLQPGTGDPLGPDAARRAVPVAGGVAGDGAGRRCPFGPAPGLSVETAARYSHQLLDVLRSVERHVLVFLFTFLSLFFIYRDGAVLLRQTRRTLCALLGERAIPYLHRVGQTLEAVIYGLVLTALGQGLMAALGYALAGLGAPLLLGLFTGLVALIPFAAPLAWGGVSLWVVFAGKLWTGIALFGWGLLVMLVVDNFIRPLLISQATRIHFLIVLYGVLGGIECFGLLGLFLGPVILSVMVAIWEEWLAHVHSRQRTEKD
ncbi:MAG TPA: AI-2E family transporter [Anaerolineae bacterium]|nr:AI-2E family transporter [Anaerolineae bacterium]